MPRMRKRSAVRLKLVGWLVKPGGVINAVSKRPTSAPVREIQLQAGSHDRKQLAVDVGGKVSGTDEFDYRLTMLDRKSNTAQDYLNDDKLYIAPALTWRPNADTALTVLSFYQKTATRFSAPLPYQLVEGVGSGPVRIIRARLKLLGQVCVLSAMTR